MNEQFEEWILKNTSQSISYEYPDYFTWFENLEFKYQWGVYLEFFDSVGIEIKDDLNGLHDFSYKIYHYDDELDIIEPFKMFETRTEAQQEAVKKAFEILEK